MTPAQLSRTVRLALRDAVAAGQLPEPAGLPDRVTLRRPPRGDADYASNLALRLAPLMDRPAPRIAAVLRDRLSADPGIDRVEVAGAGFLNITVGAGARTAVVRELLARPRPAAPAEDPAADAARWSAVTGTPVTYERRVSSPLFQVQYAHARARSLVRNAADLGLRPEPGPGTAPAEETLTALLAETARRADALGQAARPHQAARPSRAVTPAALARLLQQTAAAFFDVHDAHPPLPRGDEKPTAAHRARLALAEATGVVLAGGLSQLGISAPDHL
ncbi:DALR anticodon-binding domain-containing protein [Streptomyces sp. TRM 70351]|uniref:DALR anticodon-binding domain-containing protein n=1 Tax=Streptomyces sp. TRM 70351 TaxID=3116552 RepID=UPI002E7BD7DB|nr:DALR anticodon-binding domain-containing protein [Streptomyces sp. TRM 70351]MEE1927520.1 DALR anticodon-binding domain-containing protein [Streptomyces sp. TRM 70351]